MNVDDPRFSLVFVDCEATGPCPGKGELTEFGAVEYRTRETFHGILIESVPREDNPHLSEVTGRGFDPVGGLRGVRAMAAIGLHRPADLHQRQPGLRLAVDQLRLSPRARPQPVRPLRRGESATSTLVWSAISGTARRGSTCESRRTTTTRSTTRWATSKPSSESSTASDDPSSRLPANARMTAARSFLRQLSIRAWVGLAQDRYRLTRSERI